MASIRVVTSGTKRALRALRRLPEFVKVEARVGIEQTAKQFQREAQRRVPVRTGYLRDAIAYRVTRTPRGDVGVEGPRRTTVYWKFLEYGTVNMEARPFFRPAAQAVEYDHRQRMEKALHKADRHVARVGMSGAAGV